LKAAVPLATMVALLAAPVCAQQLPTAAVLETQSGEGVASGTDGAVDRMVRARLDGLSVVRTSSGVALDLSEVQLALGCVGETAECLGPVADELSVQLLLIPALDQSGDELMLTVTLFDRQAGTLRRVVRQARGENARAELLDAVDGLLRELFGLPAVDPQGGGEGGGGGGGGGGARPGAGPSLSPGPFVLIGVGAAALVAGIGTGVAFLGAQDEWADLGPAQTITEAEEANATFARAEALAIATDVLLPLGGAIAIAGVAWLIAELTASPSAPSTAVLPLVGPSFAGLSVEHRWGAR
jgi:hypothetical protein